MARKWYGSFQNRLEEGRQFVREIKVGDGVTEYGYSDRHAYEVIAVKDQKHITIRQYTTKRIDNNGISEMQDYEYISNEDNYSVSLVKRGNDWYAPTEMTREDLEEIERIKARGNYTASDIQFIMWAAQFDHEKVAEKGKQTKYHKWNISIGKAEEYYDPSF